MCTVSWLHRDGGFELLCNRDEKRTRAVAFGPKIRIRDGVRFIAPQDAEAGGTWIAVNEHGVAFCLLNGRGSAAVVKSPISRGLVLPGLVSSVSFIEARERIWKTDLSLFSPFTLLILTADAGSGVFEWNGREFLSVDPRMPLISSSFDPEGVRSRRRRAFDALQASRSSGALLNFHRSHGTAPDAYSTCMHRADAETVSFSRIIATRTEARFFYSPAAPCRGLPCDTRTLALLH